MLAGSHMHLFLAVGLHLPTYSYTCIHYQSPPPHSYQHLCTPNAGSVHKHCATSNITDTECYSVLFHVSLYVRIVDLPFTTFTECTYIILQYANYVRMWHVCTCLLQLFGSIARSGLSEVYTDFQVATLTQAIGHCVLQICIIPSSLSVNRYVYIVM